MAYKAFFYLTRSSQVDSNQTSSSNSSGPPAEGGGSPGKGDRFRNIFSGGFGFGGRRSSGNDNQGLSINDKEHKSGPSTIRGRNERAQMDTKPPGYHLSKDNLRDFAVQTLRILNDGEYFPPGTDQPYDLETKMKWTDENTRYYGPNAGKGGEILESEFVETNGKSGDRDRDVEMGAGTRENKSEKAATTASRRIDDNSNLKTQVQVQTPISPDPQTSATPDTPIYFGEYSTLFAARKLHLSFPENPNTVISPKIGVLNFASAKRPGGGFINGCQAQVGFFSALPFSYVLTILLLNQEESIARASTLYPSLTTPAASQFYRHYHEDPNNAYYTHAMVYSPGIVFFRDDNGEWCSPVEVDVLTSAAVNAGDIRRELEKEEGLRREREVMEVWKRKREEWRREREMEKTMPGSERGREKKILKKEKVKVKKERDGEKAEADNSKEKGIDSPESGSGVMKVETTESKATSSTTLSPQTQPSQVPKSNPDLSFALILSKAESQIQYTMYTRISRILHLFQLHQTPHLILGSFGTGVFQNRIDLVASIFADLLVKPGGRFKNVFQTVVFGILGKETLRVFLDVFWTVEQRAGGCCVFWDREVREREDEKIRLMESEAKRTTLAVASAVRTHSAAPAADGRIAEGKQMITVDNTVHHTEYFRPESTRLKHWQQGPPLAVATERHGHQSRAEVYVMKISTLQGTHFLSEKCPASRVGVLNLAQPYGGFINDASAQGESSCAVVVDSESIARREKSIIARVSTLFLSLQTPEAKPFYELHDQDNKGGYYSHAMIYSSSITISRDDQDQWVQPYQVDVVTSLAVNGHLVRSLKNGRRSETEDKILSVMRERMGRILGLFELRGTRNLVLGNFGTGVLENDIAKIWGELLGAPRARFAHSFDNVVFAIPEDRRRFQAGFNAVVHARI